jgi:hypothetical protein
VFDTPDSGSLNLPALSKVGKSYHVTYCSVTTFAVSTRLCFWCVPAVATVVVWMYPSGALV